MPAPGEVGEATSRLHDVQASDPHSILIDRSALSESDVAQCNRIMAAMSQLRTAEERLSAASNRYMKLNATDMRALRFVMVSENLGQLATPGAIAAHLNISTASTTKLLDRLERAGHIEREPHPSDRRALVIKTTAETRSTAMQTVGRQHAKKFEAAARLAPDEREVVARFLTDLAAEMSLAGVSWAEPKGRARPLER